MHRRIITRQMFKTTALELRHPQRRVGDSIAEVITGTHAQYGATVLMQDGDDYVAHVDEPSFLDALVSVKPHAGAAYGGELRLAGAVRPAS